MKDDDEGGDEGCCEGGEGGEVSDEGGEWMILSCLRSFEDGWMDERTNEWTFVNIELLPRMTMPRIIDNFAPTFPKPCI